MKLIIEQALQEGVAAHKEGKLKEAERLYRTILQAKPLHPDANHNLGLIAVAFDQPEVASSLFKVALEANPKIEKFWLSYIDVLIREKQFDLAKEILEQGKKEGVLGDNIDALAKRLLPITQVAPSEAELNDLHQCYHEGRYEDAETSALLITQEFPKHQFGWKVLGAVLKQTGRVSESLVAHQKSVQLASQDGAAHHNLGNTLKDLGKFSESEASYRQAIALNPDYVEAHNNLGILLKEMNRLDESEASYRRAITLKPSYAEAHYNLGITLKELGKFDEAEASYTQAIALKPDYAEAHNNLGVMLLKMNRLDESIEFHTKALAIQPSNLEFLSNLSTAKAKAVPAWHIPMMNEHGRNEAYQKAMNTAIRGGDVVLDIGTGAGLLSMIAADCGAKEIITCEMSKTISEIAEKIIQKNGFDHKVSVINKNSKDLIIGRDINKKVDILVSEILSSEFVGEGIQTTVLDAKKRLLKKTGRMIPEGGSIMIALIENTGKLAKEIFVDQALGYDLRDFNSIVANKWVGTLEDEPVFLSEPIEAFTFDFRNFEKIYRDTKTIRIEVNRAGGCAGVIQWLKVQLYDDIEYQNNPVEMYRSNSVSGWKTPIFMFNAPVNVTKGQSLNIKATLKENYSWFHLDSL